MTPAFAVKRIAPGVRETYLVDHTPMVVIEVPPGIRPIDAWVHRGRLCMPRDWNEAEIQTFNLGFPYMWFFVRIYPNSKGEDGWYSFTTHCFFSKEPYAGVEPVGGVIHSPLPNTGYDGGICLGTTLDSLGFNIHQSERKLGIDLKADLAATVVDTYLTTPFNSDLRGYPIPDKNYKEYSKLLTLQEWAEETEKDPNFGMNFDWKDAYGPHDSRGKAVFARLMRERSGIPDEA